jgi:hypothetical protein
LLIGLNVISLLAVVIVSGRFFLSMEESNFWVYSSLVLVGTALSYFAYRIKEKLGASEKFGVILGILSPLLTLILIIAFLMVHQTVLSQLVDFNTEQINGGVGSFGILTSFFGNNASSPLLAGVLFYLSANVFMIISIIRKKEFLALLWYLLTPVIFLIIWLVVDAFVSMISKIVGLGF